MPIPWLTVLQSVPWSDVIKNAPKVADSAKKLWNSVARKPTAAPSIPTAPMSVSEANDPGAWAARLGRIETAVAELHAQMVASSELIATLAEQQTQLVARLDAQRRRTRRLHAVVAVLALAVAGLLIAAWR